MDGTHVRMSGITAIVLAAGLGTRMKSALPKVMHPIAGRPLVLYAVRAAFGAGADRAVVVTSGRKEVEDCLVGEFGERLSIVVQEPPRGTGDAARIGISLVSSERVMIVCGDTPLVRSEDLSRLVAALDVPGAQELSLMTCSLECPEGYGRVLRDAAGFVTGVREQRDLRSPAEHAIHEVNAGMYAGRTDVLRQALAKLTTDNSQGEYYLTDVVGFVARTGRVTGVSGHADALLGVNDRNQLAQADELMLQRIRHRHGSNGVTVRGDARIDDGVQISRDAVIEAGVCLRGNTRIGASATVDVGSVITDSVIGDRVWIKPYTVISSSTVGECAQVGPFAHLRPESQLDADVHVGNFVETKKTRLRRGAKANHLSYLGDGDVGERANIGAGTIFCNYDGFNKHRTIIGSDAFIGSDSQLVAPVTVGSGAYVASGTTVTQDVPDHALAVGRSSQVNKEAYAVTLRARFAAAKEGTRSRS
jgi:bifunctional UDP-N-acetylglucosamine pyrophosphorylase / glucosamine-1-phosphate N-acetyltransferase